MPSVAPLLNGFHPAELRNLANPPSTDFGTPRWAKAVLEGLDFHEVSEGDLCPGHDRTIRRDAGGSFDYSGPAVPLEFRVP